MLMRCRVFISITTKNISKLYKMLLIKLIVCSLPRHIKLPMFFLRFLKAVNMMQSMEVDREILETQDKVAEKTEILVPYNILPLYPDSANQAIMRFPEIQAAVYALHNTRGLAWPKDYKKKKDEDILDWLGVLFGFQKHNVSNQREHLILLLANVHIRQFPKPDQQPKVANHTARSAAA
ncbi:hypothetical protein AAZV13_20G202301 [Glycine max]